MLRFVSFLKKHVIVDLFLLRLFFDLIMSTSCRKYLMLDPVHYYIYLTDALNAKRIHCSFMNRNIVFVAIFVEFAILCLHSFNMLSIYSQMKTDL